MLAYLATLPNPLYHLEDDRLSYPAYQIIVRSQVSQSYLEGWLSTFGRDLSTFGEPEATIHSTHERGAFLGQSFFPVALESTGKSHRQQNSESVDATEMQLKCN